MAFTFDQLFAVDPSNPANVAVNASVLIFAPGDTAKTPLTLTTPSGDPLANPVTVNANGFGDAFMHATLDRVAWEGGGFTGFFTSYEGMKTVATDAQAAAEASATSAANSANLVGAPADAAIATAMSGAGTQTNTTLDTAVRDKINTPGSATEVALNAAYGPTAAGMKAAFDRPRPQTLVVLGDSLTEQGGEIPANPDTRSFAAWPWANVLLGQAFTVLGNLGVGGETTTQIRARVGAAVALNPGWVALTVGTNNMGVAGGVDTAKTDIAAMLDEFDAAGIRVVLPTLPPRLSANYTGTIKADTFALNEWIRAQGRTRPGLIVPDYFTGLASGTDGNFAASLYGFNPTTDGIHLSATGGYQAGLILANALRPHVTPSVPFSLANPGANLLSNPRPAGNGAVAPTGFTVGAATWSDVPRADGLGSWKQAVTGAGTFMMNTNATVDGSRLAVGEVVNGIIEFDVSGMDQAAAVDAQGIAVSLRAWDGTAYVTPYLYAFNYFRGPNVPRSGVIRVPNFTVPAGTTIVSLFVELRGSMTFKFDRLGIYNRKTYPV